MPASSPNVVGTGTLLWCTCKRDKRGRILRNERGRPLNPDCIAERKEVLYDGPASSSKTYSDLARIYWLMCVYPGVRIIGFRRTFKSHKESIRPIFERYIIGIDHECLEHGGENRPDYTFRHPVTGKREGGSHFALAGTDDIEKHLSAEWDIAVFFEATEPGMTEYDWNTIGTRMRGVGIPHPHCDYPDGRYDKKRTVTEMLDTTDRFVARFVKRDGTYTPIGNFGLTSIDTQAAREMANQLGARLADDGCDDGNVPLFFRQRIAECNPSIVEGEQHWLMKRWRSRMMVRLFAAHADNPRNTADYMAELKALPEPFYSVYYLGKWISITGRCWPAYNPERHLVLGQFEWNAAIGCGYVKITDKNWATRGSPKVFPVASVIAGFDWGLSHPGSLQVFAVTGKGNERCAFRIAEILHGEGEDAVGSLDWWADQVVQVVDKFHVQAILCDPSARAIWEMFNKRLGPREGRTKGGICQAADNTRGTEAWVQGGIDLVNTMFARDKLFLLNDVHWGPIDPRLKHGRRPTGLHEEIPAYALARDPNNPDRVLGYPDKKRGMDDACDAARYALVDIFESDRNLRPKPIRTFAELDPTIVMSGAEEWAMREREALDNPPARPRKW